MLWTNLEIMVLTELEPRAIPSPSNVRHFVKQTITSAFSCHKLKGTLDNSTLYSSRILILQKKKESQECPRLKLIKETQRVKAIHDSGLWEYNNHYLSEQFACGLLHTRH